MNKRSELLTVAKAAKEAGVRRQAIYEAIKRGRLASEEISGVIFVRAQELAAYKPAAPRPGAGRPAKKQPPLGIDN